mmetsp:Transcript_70453/g.187624  ORF Transcript_70453/g.187624 Transcript_70453/m.187624 type:complete len:375 (-) Transcript_70453:241-1365(-)
MASTMCSRFRDAKMAFTGLAWSSWFRNLLSITSTLSSLRASAASDPRLISRRRSSWWSPSREMAQATFTKSAVMVSQTSEFSTLRGKPSMRNRVTPSWCFLLISATSSFTVIMAGTMVAFCMHSSIKSAVGPPFFRSWRSSSPADMCDHPSWSTMKSHWVPLPDPGPPMMNATCGAGSESGGGTTSPEAIRFSATGRSSGVVTFRLLSSPSTMRTTWPVASTALESSVTVSLSRATYCRADISNSRRNTCGVWASRSTSRFSVPTTLSVRGATCLMVGFTGTPNSAAPVSAAWATDRRTAEAETRGRAASCIHTRWSPLSSCCSKQFRPDITLSWRSSPGSANSTRPWYFCNHSAALYCSARTTMMRRTSAMLQ